MSRLGTRALVLAVLTPLLAWGQPSGVPSGRQVRTLVDEVVAARHADKNDMVLDLDARVRARWGDFETFPLTIVRQESLSVDLSSPFMRYRQTLAAYLKIDRPLSDIRWVDGAVVAVEPLRIDAPDVVRISMERAGRPVQPIESDLEPMTFTNGSGEQAVIHAGEVIFPMSAVAPGAPVTVTVVPRTGASIVTAIDEAQLRMLK